MASITRFYSPYAVELHGHDHAVVFTWEIDTDLFFADAAVARLFELDVREAERGLPLMTFVSGIHPDDRARAAKSIHDTILSGGPCQQDYRILQRSGPPLDVMAFGRCFKGRNGGSSYYSGIIHPAPLQQGPEVDLRSQCLAVFAAAKLQGEGKQLNTWRRRSRHSEEMATKPHPATETGCLLVSRTVTVYHVLATASEDEKAADASLRRLKIVAARTV